MQVKRRLQSQLKRMARIFPVVTVTGPRQSGKTTLCKMAFPRANYLSLEDPELRAYADQDPRGFIDDHAGKTIIDEVQRVPDLLSSIQVAVDRKKEMGRFILTGSANLSLLDTVSQSLAGRTALLTLLPMSFDELKKFPSAPQKLFEALLAGAYPAIFDREMAPGEWFASYVGTYIERDVRQLLNIGDRSTFQSFLKLCAGRTGQLLNLSSLGSDCGVVHNTIKAWLSVLETSYLIHRLPPFFRSVRRRLIKTPKLHFLDSGLICYLLGIREVEQLQLHPLRGAVFESWVVSEVLKSLLHRGREPDAHFFRDRKGHEVDLLLSHPDKLTAVEVKSSRTVASSFFDELDHFEQWATTETSVRRVSKVLVYGGERRQQRKKGEVLPWSLVSTHDWTD